MNKNILLIISTILLLCGCKKDMDVWTARVNIGDINVSTTQSSARITGSYKYVAKMKSVYVVVSKAQSMTYSSNYTATVSSDKSYRANINYLDEGTTYYFYCVFDTGYGTAKSGIKQFVTDGAVKPTVTTKSVSSITQTTASCGGNVTSDGNATVTARGVCWSTSQYPTISDSYTTNGSGTGSFTSSITGLYSNTTYYVRAYATNKKGTGYGEQRSFTTSEGGGGGTPTVTTNSVSNITQTTATCGGNVTSDGGTTVTARGVCWSTSQYPTISDSSTTNGSGTGSFTSSMTGLNANTTYYVRAYAIYNKSTVYGGQKSFTTQSGGGSYGGHEYVDLGLPSGTLWATCNVGASNPEDYGNYYAWGEKTTKSNYDWDTYKWCNNSSSGVNLTKYNNDSSNGTVDNKTVLELEDDVAYVNWGGDWRMPTRSELNELKDNCTWTETTQNGVNGRKVTGPNGNSIFLPAAGYYYENSLYYADHGFYWSSSLYLSDSRDAHCLVFNSASVRVYGDSRDLGHSVRPVR